MTSASISLNQVALTMPIAAKEELFLVAGEASGDLIGSLLIKSLKRELPKLPLVGVGGPLMTDAGLLSVGYYNKMQILGVWEILKNLPSIFRTLRQVADEILTRQPKGVVLIDFPGFNLRLAKRLRDKGYRGKIFHFVSPSVWAWRKGRIKNLVETLDVLFSIYPFEKAIYADTPLQVEYVGHPLQEILQQIDYDNQFEEKFHLIPGKPLLAIFPGSRKGELNRNLPLIVPIVEGFLKRNPDYQVAFSVNQERFSPLLKEAIQNRFSYREVPPSHTYDLMRHAHIALAKSGTVTLELAWHQVPTAVLYALSSVDFFLAKWWFNLDLPYYCMVNILAGKTVYPEWIKNGAPKEDVIPCLEKLAGESNGEIKRMCEEVWNELKPPGYLPPTQLAARKIRQAL